MLALNKKVGLLSIHSDDRGHVLFFDERGVTVYHDRRRLEERVLAAAVRLGWLDPAAVDEVRQQTVQADCGVEECLLSGGYLREEEFVQQGRVELEEEIYDLFFCREAKFEFHEGARDLEGVSGALDGRLFFNCDSIVMEAARRIDEWAYISERIPSTGVAVFATVAAVDSSQFGPDAHTLHELMDGRRTVARLAALTGLTKFQVCKPLSQMLDGGQAALVDDADLIPLADECFDDGRLEDAIALAERAVEAGVDLIEAHAVAADGHRALEQFERAVTHLQAEAEQRLAVADAAGAADCLFDARRLLPTHLVARQRLLEVCTGDDDVRVDDLDLVAEGKELVELLAEVGEFERVRVILERLLPIAPADPELKKALVNVHLRAGDQQRVIDLYESIADDLVRMNRPLEAVSYLQKILLSDRHRTDIAQRVRSLYEFDERARRRRRMLNGLAGLFCTLVVLAAGFWFYNERAEEALADIDVTAMVAVDDFAGARGQYLAFIAGHPLTTAVGKAESELQKIDSAQEMFDARRASARAEREQHRWTLRRQYRELWDDHQDQFAAGRPEEALESILRVRDLVQQAGAVQDAEWASSHKVESTLRELRDHLAAAQSLGTRYEDCLAAGDLAAARALALRLHDEFGTTSPGRLARVPVLVTTSPPGAALAAGGAPITRAVDGRAVPVITPGVVLCRVDETERLTASLAGFEDLTLDLRGRGSSEVAAVMTVTPKRVVDFGVAAQTGAGVGGGWVALGLRGGRLGVARSDGGEPRVVELDGLQSVAAAPIVASGRVLFVSNESTIECVACEVGVDPGAWPVSLGVEAVTPLVAGGGRVLLVDSAAQMRCWEQASGRELWRVDLGAPPSGPPTVARRAVYVGTTDGRVQVFDLLDGTNRGSLRGRAAVTTRVHVDDDHVVFGCADGAIRRVDCVSGDVLWQRQFDGALEDADLAVTGERVCVAALEGVLVCDSSSGEVLGQLLERAEVVAMQTRGEQVFARVRRSRGVAGSTHDVTVAFDAASLEVRWEFPHAGTAPGEAGVDELTLALPTADGRVVFIR